MKLSKKDEQTQKKIKATMAEKVILGGLAAALGAGAFYVASNKLAKMMMSAPTMLKEPIIRGDIDFPREPDFPREDAGDELRNDN